MLIQRTAALCMRSLRAGRYKHYSPVTILKNYTPRVPENRSPNVKIPGCPHAYSLITKISSLAAMKKKKKTLRRKTESRTLP